MSADSRQVSETEALIRIAVNDANLFIDLYDTTLIEVLFELPLAFHTTTLILEELDLEQREILNRFIANGRLIIRHLTTGEIESLYHLSVASRKLSIQDLSVYFYARELPNCMILTGDNHLRKEAERQKFEVHGILWVFEQLVAQKLVSKTEASHRLKTLMQTNTRLPMRECESLLEGWA